MTQGIIIDYIGEIYQLTKQDQLLFGRGEGADLNIDDTNQDLHRRFGRIWYSNECWWLGNEGSQLTIDVNDLSSISSATLAPGSITSLTFLKSAIRFTAGLTGYEILLEQTELPQDNRIDFAETNLDELSPETIDRSKIPVTGGQRLLLVALAEQKLRHPHEAITLPTNKEVCRRLGWTAKGFDRKLDRLCLKFAQTGVKGLVGSIGDHAAERRRKLVEHTVKMGVISTSDLKLLEEYP